MTLLTFTDVVLEFGDLKLLTNVQFALASGERVCLIGRNGAGKSTMLKLCSGELLPDSGEIVRKSDLQVAQLTQALPSTLDLTVRDFVRTGLAHQVELISQYKALSTTTLDRVGLKDLENLQQLIEAHVAAVGQVLHAQAAGGPGQAVGVLRREWGRGHESRLDGVILLLHVLM